MRAFWTILVLSFLVGHAFADPSVEQWAVAKKYDGQDYTNVNLKKVKVQDNGWTQYEWTEGRSLWVNSVRGWWAAVEPDGTEVYRYSSTAYEYNFPDGRVIKSDPTTKTRTWTPMTGDPAPDFELATLDGSTKVRLSSLRGSVVFLDFWASWCGPCQQALPGTEALWQRYQAKGLKVLGVNVEGNPSKANANAAQLKLTFPQLAAAAGPDGQFNWSSVQISDYAVTGIPHGVLIDKKGIIRARDTVVDDEKLIQQLLAE